MNAVFESSSNGAARRSRATRSHTDSMTGIPSQWISRPHGPMSGLHREQVKLVGVSGR